VGVDQINLQNPGPVAYPEGCALPLYLTDYFRSASQFVNVSIHTGGGACADPTPDTLGLITWQKNSTTESGSSSSTEGVQVQFREGNGLAFPQVNPAPPGGIEQECCNALVQPVLACSASMPLTVGAGTLTVSGVAANSSTLAPQAGATGPVYQAAIPVGTLQGGTYQVSASGGSAVGAFAATAGIPPPITITTNLSPGTTLVLPAQLTWTGGDASSVLEVQFRVTPPSAFGSVFELDQLVHASAGTLTLPASIFLPPFSSTGLPSGAVEIIVTQQPSTPLPPFSAPGLTLGGARTWNYVWDFRGLKH
jgi:hypothetical protein